MSAARVLAVRSEARVWSGLGREEVQAAVDLVSRLPQEISSSPDPVPVKGYGPWEAVTATKAGYP